MKITMKTPFAEMDFDMPQELISELIQKAFQYSAGGWKPENLPQDAPCVAQECPKEVQLENKPHRRIESLFGDFRASQTEAAEKQETPEEYEPEEYKGFLLIKCEHCGKIRGFCAKTPITEHRCECGGRTKLHDLKSAYLKCKCGGQYKYKTNITDETFEYNCLNCGSPVDLELNGRRNTYTTITD